MTAPCARTESSAEERCRREWAAIRSLGWVARSPGAGLHENGAASCNGRHRSADVSRTSPPALRLAEDDHHLSGGPARFPGGSRARSCNDQVVSKERLDRYSLTGPENQAAVEAGLAGGGRVRRAGPG